MVELQCDNETYSEEMNADMLVKNIGVHPVLININFGDISVSDSLYPDEQKIINQDFYVYSDTILEGVITGDIVLETEKEIIYLRRADINIQCKSKYIPQIIDLPYSFITNTEGNINLKLSVLKDDIEIESINDLFYLDPNNTRRLENTYIDSIGLGQNSFWGIDINNDTIYMTDWGNSELCIYDMDMNLITKLTGITGAAGIDVKDNRIYVTEANYGSFKIYNKSYELENTIYGLGYPGDIEVIGDDVYIVDWDNTGIMHYNTNGNYLGCLGREYLDKPAGIEEYNGKIYVSDNLKNKIFIFDYAFEIIDSIVDSLYSIEGLVFDDFGYMYVGSNDNNTVSVFSSNGEFVYRTEPLKACWADAYKIYNNKYYTLNNGDMFVYEFEGNEQLHYLNLELEKGHYLISADISNEMEMGFLNQRIYEFDVFDSDTVNIDKFIVEADTIRTDGTFPVEFEVSNIGAETFSGSYRLSLGDVCIITDTLIIGTNMAQSVIHNIDIPFEVGEYDAELMIIKDKQNIAYCTLPFNAETDFIFDYVYDNVTIMSGEFGKIPYGLRNRGIAYGSDYVKYELGEFSRDSFNILLDRNDIYNDTLYLDIADDIPSGQYNGYILTKNERKLLLFNVEGLDVSITHTLDKDAYRDGEDAVFTMYYENNNSFCPSLYSYLRYNDFTDDCLNKVGGYSSDLISINSIGISGIGEYISGLFIIDSIGQKDSILFNLYSPLLLGNGINGFVRYSNSGLYFTDWDSLIGPGLLNIPNGQYYLQYKLNLNQYTSVDSVILGSKTLKDKSDFQMNEDSIEFTVPIDEAGNSLFYSVYTNYGRSILISNEYINRINDTIQVQLDKYLYNAGDTILVNIESEYKGNLEWNISGGMDSDPYGNWEIVDSSLTEKISIPLTSVSGFYTYNYTFLGFDTTSQESIIVMNNIPFNVKGYELLVKNIHIDKEQYYPSERVYADFDIIANRDMLVNIVCYFKDESNNYSMCYNDNRWINSGSDIIGIQTDEIPFVYGNCELIYKFYLIGLNKNILMADGQEAFFINDNSSPQFIVFNLSACTIDITSNDSLIVDYRLNELCRSVHISVNNETQTFFDNISGNAYWDLLDDYGNPVAPGEYRITGKAFDYASNQSLPMYRDVYVIGEQGDTVPPVSYIVINEPKYITDTLTFIKGDETEINIISNDEDVDKLYYRINENDWQIY
ncbi:hypothetical protein KAU15_01295, partial [candidate division WOR-3 bacterium]|nr:hypothetical protein [candidate division WOR-3 bacterium]